MIGISSRFKIFPILLIVFSTVLLLFPLLAMCMSFNSPKTDRVGPFVCLVLIIFFWLTVLKTRANRVLIAKDSIQVNRYFGLGKSKVYDFSKLEGYITLFESGRLGVSENLFILEEGKRVGCISSFYHNNFDSLKASLKEKVRDLGVKK